MPSSGCAWWTATAPAPRCGAPLRESPRFPTRGGRRSSRAYTALPAIHDTSVTVTNAGVRFVQGPARFILLHYPAPDLMGHGAGGVSQPYQDSVRLTHRELTRLLGGVDLSTTTVIITSDHGHIDPGGHGGWEPVVRTVPLMFLGAGIERGGGFDARQAGTAPPIAALLG